MLSTQCLMAIKDAEIDRLKNEVRYLHSNLDRMAERQINPPVVPDASDHTVSKLLDRIEELTLENARLREIIDAVRCALDEEDD